MLSFNGNKMITTSGGGALICPDAEAKKEVTVSYTHLISMRNVAVILAGGVGTRMGGTMPKQLFKVSGKTVLEHTISVFDNHPLIDEIAIVVHLSLIHILKSSVPS